MKLINSCINLYHKEMKTNFELITLYFKQGQYGKGAHTLTKLLQQHPSNSNLHLNAGVLHSQMEQDQLALDNINQSLELNPRNYLAYFNRFSLLYRKSQDLEALESLYCSLSCLHLMVAKSRKSIQNAEKALKYCSNNVEAHVLKGLLLLQNQKHLAAYFQFEQAITLDPINEILHKLKQCAFRKAYPDQIQPRDYYCQEEQPIKTKALKSSYVRTQGIEAELRQRLSQFNMLYVEVSGSIEAFTRMLPQKQSQVKRVNSFLQYRASQGSTLQFDDPGQLTPQQSEAHPQPGQVYLRQSRFVEFESEKNEFKSIIAFPNEQLHGNKAEGEQAFEQFQSILDTVDEQTPKQEQQANNLVYEQIQANYNLIYPLDSFTLLKIQVLRLQLGQIDEIISKQWKDSYCIVSYNKTKLITTNRPCQGKECNWAQTFKPINISEEPSDMRFKVYNKRYSSIRDQFIGDIEVLITTADLLSLPLFSKKGQELGKLMIKLSLEGEKKMEEIYHDSI